MQDQSLPEFSFKYLFFPFTTAKAIHWIIVIGIVVFANVLYLLIQENKPVNNNTIE